MLTVEVFDAAGTSYGAYFVQINTEDFDAVCASGLNAAEAQVLSTHLVYCHLSCLFRAANTRRPSDTLMLIAYIVLEHIICSSWVPCWMQAIECDKLTAQGAIVSIT